MEPHKEGIRELYVFYKGKPFSFLQLGKLFMSFIINLCLLIPLYKVIYCNKRLTIAHKNMNLL